MRYTDVALIFSSRDSEKAEQLGKMLKMEGISVWQSRLISPERPFNNQIIEKHMPVKSLFFLHPKLPALPA